MNGNEALDVELESPSHRGHGVRDRLYVLAGLALFVAIGIVGFSIMRDNSPDLPSAENDPVPPDVSDDGYPLVSVDAAGRYDGLDSVRLALELTPDSGLVDGDVVAARGAGFTPNATVGIIQCAGIGGEGSVDNCDLSNYVLGNADAQGYVDMRLEVRRFIANGDGEIDCAADDEVNCAVAIGNIANYDESGVATVWFDGNVDGARSPVIAVDRVSGLRDGDALLVTGMNFGAGETVQLSQCVVGGSYSFDGCFFSESVTDTVIAEADGTFSVSVSARRHLLNGIDCFDDVYGCRMAAAGTSDAPNPVRLYYDGSVRSPDGVSLTLSPSFDLADGSVVTVGLAEVPNDGEVVAVQCVDQGPLGVTCAEPVTATVIDGSAEFPIVIARELVNEAGDIVDCGQPSRVCELRFTGVHEHNAALRFAP